MYSLNFAEEPLTEASLYSSDDLCQLNPDKVPHHVAIITDGNRRWAKKRGMPTTMGHLKGAETLTKIVKAASELGIRVLTIYAFSTENWNRSKEEVDALMTLFKMYLRKQREPMLKQGVRLGTIGNFALIPKSVICELEMTCKATEQCEKIDLVLAINYGGRDDIRRAFLAMVADYESGKLSKEHFSEQKISEYLDTARWPDPELVIRASGEKRQSNFLLWQSSYSEFYHTDVLWPDFDEKELLKAVLEFQERKRRLGG